jgi:hypothetical protein
MKRQNVIILLSEKGSVECFGNFKKCCEIKGFPYHSLKIIKEFPIEYGGYKICRVPFL